MAEKKQDKAQRLLNENKVKVVFLDRPTIGPPKAAVFAVIGDTKPYLVTVLDEERRGIAQRVGAPPSSCSCEAYGACSHLLACHGMFRHLQENHSG